MTVMDMPFYWCMLFCVLLSSAHLEAAPEGSLITHLPGFTGNFPSKHYSGYVTIENQKNLFYYFVVSERNASKDPVVLWLNGGPGCSSFDGFVYEHGPFHFQAGKQNRRLPTLQLNPFSWSKVSNMIYLDSPVGVGLSYSKNLSVYETGDLQTAEDIHSFLLKWLNLYSEFADNPFYVAGESYAGVYVPTLASQIVKGIQAGTKPIIKFKGYIVGNGVADPNFDGNNALVPFAHGMGLISDDMYENAKIACHGKYHQEHPDPNCISALGKIDAALGFLNIYDVLEPCFHDPTSNKDSEANNISLPESFKQLGQSNKRPLPVRKRIYGRAWPLWAPVKDGKVPSWPELSKQFSGVSCFDDRVATEWLNDESVRKAMHAEPISIAGSWELCTDRIFYRSDAGSMIPYHKNLTAQGYRALIYSGDHDMCVPFTGSQAWTRSLGYNVVDEWRPWMSIDQVAGYLQEYSHNLTFLTIKGAGHTVPEYKPQESLDFYTRWLDGKPV